MEHNKDSTMKQQKATTEDYNAVITFYEDVMARTPGIGHLAQWRKGTHPTEEGIKAFIEEGSLYLYKEEDTIIGAMAVSMSQCEELSAAEWPRKLSDDEVAVIELLAVNPDKQGAGIGATMVREAIELASINRKKAIRLDATASNTPVHRLYERLGFSFQGRQSLNAENVGPLEFFLYEYTINP